MVGCFLALRIYQNDKSFSFIHTILIVLLEFSACLARLLLEKTHQVG